MIYKEGVVWRGLHWRMRNVKKTVDEVWAEHGEEAVMTSGLDSTHSENSWHYHGCAADFRTRYFDADEAAEVATELSQKLKVIDDRYQVVLHASSHIHVEWDPYG